VTRVTFRIRHLVSGGQGVTRPTAAGMDLNGVDAGPDGGVVGHDGSSSSRLVLKMLMPLIGLSLDEHGHTIGMIRAACSAIIRLACSQTIGRESSSRLSGFCFSTISAYVLTCAHRSCSSRR
jgi:hypothetical protein